MPPVAGKPHPCRTLAGARTTKQEARIDHFVRAIVVQARRPSLFTS